MGPLALCTVASRARGSHTPTDTRTYSLLSGRLHQCGSETKGRATTANVFVVFILEAGRRHQNTLWYVSLFSSAPPSRPPRSAAIWVSGYVGGRRCPSQAPTRGVTVAWRLGGVVASSPLAPHHTRHFLSGFMALPTGQLKASLNSSEFDNVPITLWEKVFLSATGFQPRVQTRS